MTDRPRKAEVTPSTELPVPGNGRWKHRTHAWIRVIHVYVSMASLLIVLFFGVTGITLNHPDWTFGTESSATTASGAVPAEAMIDGQVEFLILSEFIRSEHDVKGEVSDFGQDGTEATISYKAPGYAAEVSAEVDTGQYSITVRQEGFVSVMNDLHKGRDASTAWRWIIDLSGALLVVIGLTGIGLQLFLRRRRFTALSLSVVGGLLSIVLIWIATT